MQFSLPLDPLPHRPTAKASAQNPVAIHAVERPAVLAPVNQRWLDQIFSAHMINRAGVVRRAVRDVEREIGRDVLVAEVRRRGFHLLECGEQFIIICNSARIKTHC